MGRDGAAGQKQCSLESLVRMTKALPVSMSPTRAAPEQKGPDGLEVHSS